MDAAAVGLLFVALVAAISVGAWLGSGAFRQQQHRGRGTLARMAADGVQEVSIVVRDGYHPNRIRVYAGTPVRIAFDRQEANPCSACVFFSEPRIDRPLAPHAVTTVALTPVRVGVHLFTCEEGRFRGHLIVVPPGKGDPSTRGRRSIKDFPIVAPLSLLTAWAHPRLRGLRDDCLQ